MSRLDHALARAKLWGLPVWIAGAQAVAPPQFWFDPLPELLGGASEVHDAAFMAEPSAPSVGDTVRLSGRALDGDGIWKAVVWTKPTGQPWDIDVLPNPFGNTESSAIAVRAICTDGTCDIGEDCISCLRIAGFANSAKGIPQPVVWTGDGVGPWTAEVLPFPPDGVGGSVLAFNNCPRDCGTCPYPPLSVGRIDLLDGSAKAVAWTWDEANQTWTVELLPDYGIELSSDARSIVVDPSTCLSIIGGSVQTESSPQVPCVWQELPGGGFERIELPMAPGAYLAGIRQLKVGDEVDLEQASFAVGHDARVAGLADLYRGVLYRRTAGVWGNPLELPPLPGLRDSRATSVLSEWQQGTQEPAEAISFGLSYMELSPGSERATMWDVAPDNTISVYDLNDQTANLPPEVTLQGIGAITGFGMSGTFTSVVGTYTNNGDLGNTPHAEILILLSGNDCNMNGEDDAIDLYLGTSTDSNANGVPDECEPPGNIVWEPATNPTPWPNNNPEAATRSLMFRVIAPAAQTATGTPPQVAIKVTMIDLQNPIPPNLPQYPPPNFGGYESGTCAPMTCVGGARGGLTCTVPADCPSGTCTSTVEDNGCARWVGKPGTFLEYQDSPWEGNYRAARLQCTPFYYDWVTETAGNVCVRGGFNNPSNGQSCVNNSDCTAPATCDPKKITVVGAEIVPSSEYSVQTYGASCKGLEAGCTNVSAPMTMYTRRSGDVGPNFNPPATSTQPDAIDVAQMVRKVRRATGALVKVITQLQPNLPELNADVNALDIVAVVDGVKERAYAFSGPCPCPSEVPCGATPCAGAQVDNPTCVTAFGAGAMCVKTCVGGANAGDPCINNTHCPGSTCGEEDATPGFCRDRCGRCSP